jgi:hypothetical protein
LFMVVGGCEGRGAHQSDASTHSCAWLTIHNKFLSEQRDVYFAEKTASIGLVIVEISSVLFMMDWWV